MGTEYILTDDDKPAAEPSLAEDVIEIRLLTASEPTGPANIGWAQEHHTLYPPGSETLPTPISFAEGTGERPALRCRPFLMPGIVPTPGATTATPPGHSGR